jgi:hypothetical protein
MPQAVSTFKVLSSYEKLCNTVTESFAETDQIKYMYLIYSSNNISSEASKTLIQCLVNRNTGKDEHAINTKEELLQVKALQK